MTDETPAPPARGGRRGGGREARRNLRAGGVTNVSSFLTRSIEPFELISDEGLELLEHNADTILERVGVEIRDYPSALERFRDAGADVTGTRVRFPRGLCRQIVQNSTPATYTQHARNPERNVQIGGDATVFVPNYGSPFVHDIDTGRRYATIADFENFVKLAYLCTVPPPQRRNGVRAGRRAREQTTPRHGVRPPKYSDKPFMGSVTAGERAADSVEMARIAFGGDLAVTAR